MTDRERELQRLVLAMAEKLWLMSQHLTLLAEKKKKPVDG